MSTASRTIQLLNDLVSQEPLGHISMSDGHEIEIASQLFIALKSILTSGSYDHEYATTLDYSTPDTELTLVKKTQTNRLPIKTKKKKKKKKIHRHPSTKASLLLT